MFAQKLASLRHFVSRYRLPILAGFLIGTSYIPFPPWALFFCLSPLFTFWWKRAESEREAFAAGWITQFILNLIGFHWIAYTAVEFGHFHWVFGVFVLLGFAMVAHLHYPISGWIAFKINRKLGVEGPWRLASHAIAFALFDRLITKIFSWHLGYPWLWAGWPGAQFSDVIGFEGLNYLTIAVSALLAWSVVQGICPLATPFGLRPFARALTLLPRAPRSAWFAALLAGLLISGANLLGFGREAKWLSPDSELKVLIVQGNIGNWEKFYVEYQADFAAPIVEKYLKLAREAHALHPEADVMLWPETAFPAALDPAYANNKLQADVRGFARDLHLPLLTGSYSYQRRGKVNDVYNGVFFIDGAGNLPLAPYRKSILLIFGETFPFSEYIPYMQWLFPDQGSFMRGGGPLAWPLELGTKRVSVGPQICYEGLYPWHSSEMARQGAELFVNVTNDSWFWKPFEPNQHLYMTMARAIEFRRPLVRATNTGISTAMLASGEILDKSPIGEEWYGLFRIPFQSQPEHTFYERTGFLWPWILAGLWLLVLVFGKSLGVGFRRK